MVTNVNEDWVSATQATNGVAGIRSEKGELLTLRFFQENILGDVNPNALVVAMSGLSRPHPPVVSPSSSTALARLEDLILILDLKAANGTQVTRAVNVQNSDLIKGNANTSLPVQHRVHAR